MHERIGENIVHVGFGFIPSFGHPLGVLAHILCG